MNKVDEKYLELVDTVLSEGTDKSDRTGVGTRSVFGYQTKFPLSYENFPILTVKKVIFRSVVYELIWFISGSQNISYLRENDVGIWDQWADDSGHLGPVYGYQWRSWPTPDGGSIDQLKNTIDNIRDNPNSRRHVVSAWNVSQLQDMALVPCHFAFQFYSKPMSLKDRVELFYDWFGGTHIEQQPMNKETLDHYDIPNRELSCKINIRSNDIFIGAPFNISSYSLLTLMICKLTNHAPGELVYSIGDAHIYQNHYKQCVEMMNNESYELPSVDIHDRATCIDDYERRDIELRNYKSNEFIKAPVAE